MGLHQSYRESSNKENSKVSNNNRVSIDHTWRALGSPCRVSAYHHDPHTLDRFLKAGLAWLDSFEKRYSRFLPDSLISQINSSAGSGEWVEIDEEAEAIFDLCDSLNFTTKGAIDPTLGPLVKCWYKVASLPSPETIADALKLTGWQKVDRKSNAVRLPLKGMSIDLGCFGKEYATDQLGLIAEANGIDDYLIDLGRDIRTKGKPDGSSFWHIGIENPTTPGESLIGLALNNHAIAASGNYRQFVEFNGVRYGHIIDPKTGYPVINNMRAAHVIASSCLQAGILSTSAMVLGVKDGLDLINSTFDVHALLISDIDFYQSRLFPEFVVRKSE